MSNGQNMTPTEFSNSSPCYEASPSWSSSELITDIDNLDDPKDYLSEYSNITLQTSWQEEAHWMSFRNAVQMFALLKINVSTSNARKEESKSGIKIENNDSSDNAFLSGKKDILPPAGFSSSECSGTGLASDLAETKMRLALAKAERDELEFALFNDNCEKVDSL